MKHEAVKRILAAPGAPEPAGPYAQAVEAGGLVFCSGQIPVRADGTAERGSAARQTQAVLENLFAVLRAAGCGPEQVVKCNVYLSDMAHFAEMNEAYRAAFGAHCPARLCIQTPGICGGFDVEIDAVAAKG